MCFQLCMKVSDSTRWLQNEQDLFIYLFLNEQDLYLWSAGRRSGQMNYIIINIPSECWFFLTAVYLGVSPHIIPLSHAQTHTTHIECAAQKSFKNFTNSSPSQFPYSCPHLKLIKAYETGFLCDLHGNRKDGVIHCHFTYPSLWQAQFQFVDPWMEGTN